MVLELQYEVDLRETKRRCPCGRRSKGLPPGARDEERHEGLEQAYAVGRAAVEFALAGKDKVMPTIVRTGEEPYRWKIGEAKLSRVANVERMMPKSFITRDGFGITAKGKRYLAPLIAGEDYPPYKNGMPQYVRLKNHLVAKKLTPFKV